MSDLQERPSTIGARCREWAWKERSCGHVHLVTDECPTDCPECIHNEMFLDEQIALAVMRAAVRREDYAQASPAEARKPE